jgi:hypothetical protein
MAIGFVIIIGDFNARIQTKLTEEEDCIGNYTFNADHVRINTQTEDTIDNRDRLIGFATGIKGRIANICF